MLYGTGNFAGYTATISSGNNDSQPGSIVANWCPAGVARNITLDDVVTSGSQNLVTGSVITNLLVKNINNGAQIGQNTEYVYLNSGKLASVDEHGVGLVMAGPLNPPFMIQIPIVTGVTAISSGSGTVTAGNDIIREHAGSTENDAKKN